jgi:hypothetical protein
MDGDRVPEVVLDKKFFDCRNISYICGVSTRWESRIFLASL